MDDKFEIKSNTFTILILMSNFSSKKRENLHCATLQVLVTTATQEFKKEREKKYKVDPKVLFMDFPCTSYVTIAGIAKLCPKNHKAFESEFNDLCPW